MATSPEPVAHTPGPWVAEYVGCEKAVLIGDADRVLAFAKMVQFDGTPDAETQAANARLIAAAPELLTTLKAFLAEADAGHVSVEADRNARAAIARATGAA